LTAIRAGLSSGESSQPILRKETEIAMFILAQNELVQSSWDYTILSAIAGTIVGAALLAYVMMAIGQQRRVRSKSKVIATDQDVL
jgi:formate/nitrite transporter FocA (FNT family)